MTTRAVEAPPAQSTPRRVAAGFGTFALFVAIGGDAVRNTIGVAWWVVVCIATAVALVGLLVAVRPRLDIHRLPKSLIAYLALALVSVAWSAHATSTLVTFAGVLLCTIVGVYTALMFTWAGVLARLANALKWVVGLSLLFELFVSVVIRDKVLPLSGGVYVSDEPPLLSYWSRNLLFSGGKIQGILGNSNLLSICALLLIVAVAVGVQLHARTVRRGWGWAWMAVGVLVFLLTRSSTMIIAAAVLAVVLAAVAIARRATPGGRTALYAVLAAGVLAVAAAIALFPGQLLALLGKSDDLTGRLEIWSRVIEAARERPWFGWGFSSPWMSGDAPFEDPIVRHGVVQLHAHDAWLDVWLQLGVVGVALFASLVVSVCWRSWFAAVDRPRVDAGPTLPHSPLAVLPLLMIAVLVVQSLAESRILVESGWVLLTLLALKTKQEPQIVEPLAVRRRVESRVA